MPGLPWADFLAHPTDFLDPRLVCGGILNRPETMSIGHLFDFAASIRTFQSSNGTISIFQAKEFLAQSLAASQSKYEPLDEFDAVVDEDVEEVIHHSSPLSLMVSPLESNGPNPRGPDPHAQVGNSASITDTLALAPPALSSPPAVSAPPALPIPSTSSRASPSSIPQNIIAPKADVPKPPKGTKRKAIG